MKVRFQTTWDIEVFFLFLFFIFTGMQIANGEFVVLLNSDVLVLPGWLKMLLRTIHSFPSGRVGMVGSMMLDTEGNIMEAGGGIFRFGQPFNMGRGFMPSDLPLQQARVVDYVSAACLLVRRKLFLTLGLFDPKYAPAYFEDTDAGLVHAEHGWKTILQPLSVVVHLEGSSYGKSGKSNVKDNLMEQNAQKFADSHKMLLESSCPAPRYDLPLHTESRLDVHTGFSFYRQPNRVLFLEDIVPEPDRDAGSIRLAALLHILTELGMTVTFESQYVPGRNIRYLLSLFADGVNAVMPGTLRDMASNAVALRTSSALSHVYSRINLCPYDLVIIARRDVFTERIADVKTLCPNVPIVFDTVDVHFIRELRMYNISNQQKKDKEVELQHIHSGRKLELGHMKLSNVTLVVSTEEQRILQELLGEKADIRVISNIYKVESESKSATTSIDDGGNRTEGGDVSTQRRSGAVFVGNMCHHPNIDAVDFIVRHILNSEHAKSKFPKDFKMHFVWSRSQMCPNKVLEEAKRHPMVVVHRDISNDELLLLHQKVKIVLAPLRYGAGVKGKVNYALLHGVPVIATKIAAEGMGLVHETNCLLAETGEEFAIAISRISDEEALFQKLTKGGKDIMRKLFGRDIAKDKMRQVIQDMGISLPTAGSSDANQVTVRNSTGTTGNMQQHHTCQHLKEFELYREELGSFWRVEKHLMPSPRTRAKKKSATRKKVKRNGILLHDEGVVFPVYPRFPFSRDFIQYV
jgi:glycosyltransferase involved in cell wall biosynthesis